MIGSGPPPLSIKRGWMAPMVLASLAALTFSPGLSGDFVLDDKFAIVGHRVVQGFGLGRPPR